MTAGTDKDILVFDRTPVARIVSCAAVLASAALFFDYLSRGLDKVHFLPLAGLVLLMIGTWLSALLQYGDHIYFRQDGVMYRNRFFPRFGRANRWMKWEDVVEVREIRRKILVLLARDGRRMLVDAIGGYHIAKREILRRVPHAVVSGTLVQDEQS
jgi:hypothetical protein